MNGDSPRDELIRACEYGVIADRFFNEGELDAMEALLELLTKPQDGAK